jgi:glycosyltransferase involved in cell wall biosynthesis
VRFADSFQAIALREVLVDRALATPTPACSSSGTDSRREERMDNRLPGVQGSVGSSGERMTITPLVSVIIPTRDRPALAARAVRSALEQTYPNQEIVVVDDGSDVPLALPRHLVADRRVRTIRLEASVGAGGARNAGVQASTGPLLAFLDDDDRWRPRKIERQVQTLGRCDERTAAVESGYELWVGTCLVERYLPSPDRDLRKALLVHAHMQPSTVLLRRSAFTRLGGFDPSLLRAEDWDLWLRFADFYRVAALREIQVDRDDSSVGADLLLTWYRTMLGRLEPRIALLPRRERSAVRAAHLLVESSLLARLGKPRAARRKAWLALREHPAGWPRSALYMIRTIVGEDAWSTGKRTFRKALL